MGNLIQLKNAQKLSQVLDGTSLAFELSFVKLEELLDGGDERLYQETLRIQLDTLLNGNF